MAQPSSSSARPAQPIPRMTDSMLPSQAGPGPSSFKLAALSAQSFHLDSPPFTGTAGPLGEAGDYERLPFSTQDGASVRAPARNAADASRPGPGSHETGHGNPSNLNTARSAIPSDADAHAQQAGQSAPDARQTVNSRQGTDNDVPPWRLDEAARRQSDGRSGEATATGTTTTDQNNLPSSFSPSAVHTHTHSSSLSPPPFSSSSNGPMGTSTSAAQQRAELNAIVQARVPRKRELSRPTFTQTSHADSATSNFEDAASSAAGEAENETEVEEEGDADADDDLHPPDGEVDGDGRPFVLRGLNGTPKRMPLQSQTKEEYRFPRHRLPTRMRNESKIPLVIVACGSFSPPTYLHLRIFEMAKDQVIESGKYELLGGYYSPVSDYYKKEGLAKATHRVRMCELAVEKTSTWLMVDAWESLQDEYQRTAVVLDHFDDEINGGPEGGIQTSDGVRRRIRIMLLAGGDLIQSMGEPGVWADVDLHHILGKYGCMIVERTGADVWSFLLSHDLLWRYRKNLKIVKQTIFNDISSSKVRLFVRRGQSIKYLLPNSVIHYIEQHQLYRLPEGLDTEPPDADLQQF